MTNGAPTGKECDLSFSPLNPTGSSSPVTHTLRAIAALSAHVRRDIRCAILLLENEGLRVAADYGLLDEDRQILDRFSAQTFVSALSHLKRLPCSYVKPLLTPAAELVGALVVFGPHRLPDESAVDKELHDVCCMATLAIEQQHLAEELSYRVRRDALTHLWNRVWMEDEIQRVLTLRSGTETEVGLAIVGVDRFRVINDVLGYQVGNELLCQIARRVAGRLEGSFSLARGSADEFMVLMPDLASPEQAKAISHRFLGCFDEPFAIGDHELVIKASIGYTTVHAASCTSTELESQAYTALRYAKKRARGKVAAFHPSMVRIPPERLVMEQHLRFALGKREFEVYYQPQINLSTGRMVGVEALLRWKHPALGFISPAVFIPLAEEIGLIEEIGEWVLEQAIRQSEEWERSGLSDLRISVNVSALQFARADFGAWVENKLRNSPIEPGKLELEITESAIMTNFEHALRQMNALRNLGVTLAIDDFGTGHSSLAYLQKLPVQRLKIDRMFVSPIVTEQDRPPLLASIVQMAHALRLSTVAEGAETAEQLSVLLDLQCEDVQGFVFSKPVPPQDLLEWAKRRESARSDAPRPLARLSA